MELRKFANWSTRGRTIPLIFALALSAVWFAPSPASATLVGGTYSNDSDASNQATGFPSGPFTLTSAPGTYSYVDFIPNGNFTFGAITSLSATFTDLAGGAYGGSPRMEVYLNTGDFITVYLGALPSFIESDPSTFTTDFSNTNLINGTNDAAYGIGPPYTTFSSFDATYDTDLVTNISFILDGGWGPSDQTLTLNSINVDASPVPEPASIALLGAALIGFGWVRRRGLA